MTRRLAQLQATSEPFSKPSVGGSDPPSCSLPHYHPRRLPSPFIFCVDWFVCGLSHGVLSISNTTVPQCLEGYLVGDRFQ